MILALSAKGAARILVSEPSAARAETARSLADIHVLDHASPSLAVDVRQLGGGQGPDIVFDCAGVQKGIDFAFDAVRKQGTIVNVASWASKPVVNVNALSLKQLTYIGVEAYTRQHFEEVIAKIASGNRHILL